MCVCVCVYNVICVDRLCNCAHQGVSVSVTLSISVDA